MKDKIKKLRITTLGLSLSSLETVFIRICDECDIAMAKEKNLDDKRIVAERAYEKLADSKTGKLICGKEHFNLSRTTRHRIGSPISTVQRID